MKIFDEFKQFISRGNPLDLAIEVIIGGAFGKLVNSIADNLLMLPLVYITSDKRFNSLKFVLKKKI
nr:MscL family protein [Bacteroidetes bacterium endosymbiont of Geopemphigus sp.]